MSMSWSSPDADVLGDIRAFMDKAERDWRAMLSVPPADVGPDGEILRCPVDGMPRSRCRMIWGCDPRHEEDIRAALSREFPGG